MSEEYKQKELEMDLAMAYNGALAKILNQEATDYSAVPATVFEDKYSELIVKVVVERFKSGN